MAFYCFCIQRGAHACCLQDDRRSTASRRRRGSRARGRRHSLRRATLARRPCARSLHAQRSICTDSALPCIVRSFPRPWGGGHKKRSACSGPGRRSQRRRQASRHTKVEHAGCVGCWACTYARFTSTRALCATPAPRRPPRPQAQGFPRRGGRAGRGACRRQRGQYIASCMHTCLLLAGPSASCAQGTAWQWRFIAFVYSVVRVLVACRAGGAQKARGGGGAEPVNAHAASLELRELEGLVRVRCMRSAVSAQTVLCLALYVLLRGHGAAARRSGSQAVPGTVTAADGRSHATPKSSMLAVQVAAHVCKVLVHHAAPYRPQRRAQAEERPGGGRGACRRQRGQYIAYCMHAHVLKVCRAVGQCVAHMQGTTWRCFFIAFVYSVAHVLVVCRAAARASQARGSAASAEPRRHGGLARGVFVHSTRKAQRSICTDGVLPCILRTFARPWGSSRR